MPGRKNGNNNNLIEQQEQRLYETTLKNTGMAMRGQVDEGDEIEQFLSSRRPFYVDSYADLSEEERRHREPEILAVNGYTEARYRNTLTVEQANVYKNALIAYYMSMAAVSRPKNRTEETEKKLAQCKIDMLRNGWTPEDMALVDSIFLRTYDSDRKVRDKAEKCLDEIRKIKIEHVSDRAKAHASVQDLIEEMEKNNPFGSMILDGCARNTFERPILPVEYPQDEAYQQMLNDMMVTNLQGEEEVAGANAYLRDRAEERRKDEQAQLRTRLKDDYVMPVTSEKGDNNYKANLAQVPAWRGGISNRAAAKAVFGDAAYDLIDEARKGSVQKRTVPLHHSRGNRQLMQGEPVLELDFAGTGFIQTRRDHHGLDGWDEPKKEGAGNERLARLLNQEYGELVPGYKHIREKNTTVTAQNGQEMTKKRYTVAGPNTRNNNDYAINNMREFGKNKILDFVKPILKDYKERLENGADPADLPPIHVNITGHSRGAVTAAEALKIANDQLKADVELKDLINYVHYDLIQRDPVPGFGDRTEHGEVDLSGVQNLNSTVFYSISTEYYDWMFRPQVVKGTDRVIISAMSHSTYLDSADLSQMTVEKDGMAHRRGIYDAETGEFYRGSGLSELPKGFFFMDDNQNLIRIDSLSQVIKLSDTLFSGALNFGRQPQREAVIKNTMVNWLLTHDLEVSYFDEGQRGHVKESMNKAAAKILASNDPEYQEIKEALQTVREMDTFVSQNDGADLADYGDAMKAVAAACKKYMKVVRFPNDNEKMIAAVSDILAGAQRESNYASRGLDRIPGLEKEGVAQRKLELNGQRMLAAGQVKGIVSAIAWEAETLLARLNNVKHNTNERTYEDLKDALKAAAALSGASTYNESMKVMERLSEAAAAYQGMHRKETLQGERRASNKNTGALCANLISENLKPFMDAGKDVFYKDTRIDDLLLRTGKTIAHYQNAVRDMELAALEKKEGQAKKPAAGTENKVQEKGIVSDLEKLEKKTGYRTAGPENGSAGKKPVHTGGAQDKKQDHTDQIQDKGPEVPRKTYLS